MNRFTFHVLIALLFTSSLFFLPKGMAYKYELAICTIFQNEAPYLKEWIEFHKLVGVQHFYLYNNASTDNSEEILQPYIINGEVDLIDWPYTFSASEWHKWNSFQCSAYNHALETFRQDARWIAFLDSDEFLFPSKGNNLVEFIKDYAEFGGLAVHWQCYGTSKVKKIPSDKLMVEVLLMRASNTKKGKFGGNDWVKSIVRPECVVNFDSPHTPNCKSPFFIVNANKSQFFGLRSNNIVVDKIRINHYWTRDEDYVINHKIKRGWSQTPPEIMWQKVNEYNAVNDGAILRFVPELRKKLGLTKSKGRISR